MKAREMAVLPQPEGPSTIVAFPFGIPPPVMSSRPGTPVLIRTSARSGVLSMDSTVSARRYTSTPDWVILIE